MVSNKIKSEKPTNIEFAGFFTLKIDLENMILILFDKLSSINEIFIFSLRVGMLILGQKYLFLGSTIFEIPQPN